MLLMAFCRFHMRPCLARGLDHRAGSHLEIPSWPRGSEVPADSGAVPTVEISTPVAWIPPKKHGFAPRIAASGGVSGLYTPVSPLCKLGEPLQQRSLADFEARTIGAACSHLQLSMSRPKRYSSPLARPPSKLSACGAA